jgi:hypothetical protein
VTKSFCRIIQRRFPRTKRKRPVAKVMKKKRRFENVGIGLKRIDVIISEKTDKENPTSRNRWSKPSRNSSDTYGFLCWFDGTYCQRKKGLPLILKDLKALAEQKKRSRKDATAADWIGVTLTVEFRWHAKPPQTWWNTALPNKKRNGIPFSFRPFTPKWRASWWYRTVQFLTASSHFRSNLRHKRKRPRSHLNR